MNPKRQFRQLRDDDRWIGLPLTSSSTPRPHASTAPSSRSRGVRVTSAVAFLIAGVVVAGLWAGVSGLHQTPPAAPSSLPSSTLQPRPTISTPCNDPIRLTPIGCATYIATAAAGIPGGTSSWTGALPPTLALREVNGKVRALIGAGCNELTVPLALSTTTLTPTGSAGSTDALCPGAPSAQQQWMTELFSAPITYTLHGTNLRLRAESRTLDLAPTVPTTPSPQPSPSVARPASAGCTPTVATTPPGSKTAQIADVDGDGRRDTEWALMIGGDIHFGITTASGATISATAEFAGGAPRRFVTGRLANGAVILMPSEGRSTDLWTLSDCAFHQARSGTPETGGATGVFGISIAWNNDGGAATCLDGRLAALSWKPDSTSTDTFTARFIDLTTNGATATLTGSTKVVAQHVALNTPAGKRYTGVSCGTSPVLTFN